MLLQCPVWEVLHVPKLIRFKGGLIVVGYQVLGCSSATSHICNFSFFWLQNCLCRLSVRSV